MATNSPAKLRGQIEELERRIEAERMYLKADVSGTRRSLQESMSSYKGMLGLFLAAALVGVWAGIRTRGSRLRRG